MDVLLQSQSEVMTIRSYTCLKHPVNSAKMEPDLPGASAIYSSVLWDYSLVVSSYSVLGRFGEVHF